MEVEIDMTKTVDENAAAYYSKAKKAKKKLEGITKAIEESKKKLEQEQDKQSQDEAAVSRKEEKKQRKKEWFEKFRWFFTSKQKLVIGGKDATTNEMIIKKHTEPHDLVFHTDMAGSPFMVIKSEGNPIDDIEKEETAEFLACFSKAWKAGIGSIEVFYVNPDQVTKEAQSGEYLSKGSFMIKGKTNYLHAVLKMAITVIDDRVYAGPLNAIRSLLSRTFPEEKQSGLEKKYLTILQGTMKTSQTAKEIKKKLGGEIDEISRMLPPGGCRIGK